MNPNTNYANFTFAAEALTALDAAMTSADTNTAFLPTIDPALMKNLVHIGQKTETFTREAIALGKLYPDLLPKGLNLTQAEAALANRELLRERFMKARLLMERLEVAMSLCGTDAFNIGIAGYRAMKVNGRDPSLKAAIRELGRTFRGAKKENETEPTPPDETPTGTGSGSGTGNPAGGGQA